MAKIATLLTCHNRCKKTLACLDALFQCKLPEGCSLEVFLVDDGSTDDTDTAVRARYPQVSLIKGDGNLYWNGGMRLAFAAAMEKDFDYYLWLNDDTLLYPHAISMLLRTEKLVNVASLIVGSTQGELDGEVTYGGKVRVSKWHPLRYQLVIPTDTEIYCDTMNGNCVLIPRIIALTIGNLDEAFIHTIGDIDYGLRARMVGFRVVVMPGYAGSCNSNPIDNTFADARLSVRDRLARLNGKKGLPLQAWKIFTRRHCGGLWVVFWLLPYFKIILQSILLSKVTRG